MVKSDKESQRRWVHPWFFYIKKQIDLDTLTIVQEQYVWHYRVKYKSKESLTLPPTGGWGGQCDPHRYTWLWCDLTGENRRSKLCDISCFFAGCWHAGVPTRHENMNFRNFWLYKIFFAHQVHLCEATICTKIQLHTMS